jgi:hypothetical protein
MTRIKAALLHLGICLVAGAFLFSFFWYLLYPAPTFAAAGGIEIFLLLLLVDVVIGPLLTFVVFKVGKPSLKFDLATIGLIQLVALSYGVYVLFLGRPVFIANVSVRFDLIQANEVEPVDVEKSGAKLPIIGPKFVGTIRPDDPKERERLAFAGSSGLDYGHFPQHHQPLENMRDEILKNTQPISDLKKENPGDEEAIDRWLEQRGVKADEVIYQGLKARAKDMAVIMDAKTAKVIGIAPFKPWP